MFKSDKVHEVKRMWNGGPLRQFSEGRGTASWTAYDGGGYAGSYICDSCSEAVLGLYLAIPGIWVCADCRRRAKPTRQRAATGQILAAE